MTKTSCAVAPPPIIRSLSSFIANVDKNILAISSLKSFFVFLWFPHHNIMNSEMGWIWFSFWLRLNPFNGHLAWDGSESNPQNCLIAPLICFKDRFTRSYSSILVIHPDRGLSRSDRQNIQSWLWTAMCTVGKSQTNVTCATIKKSSWNLGKEVIQTLW